MSKNVGLYYNTLNTGLQETLDTHVNLLSNGNVRWLRRMLHPGELR